MPSLSTRLLYVAFALAFGGCAPEEASTVSALSWGEPAPALELVPASPFASALGSDNRPTFRVLRDGRPVEGLGPVVSATRWREGHVVWAADGDAWYLSGPSRGEQVGPEQVSPEQVGPEQVGPEQVGPEQVSPEQVSPEQVSPEQVGPEQVSGQRRRGAQPTGASAELLARDVVAAPQLGPGERLVLVMRTEAGLIIRRQQLDEVVDTHVDLLTLGAIRVVDELGTLVGIGAINGGVAGYHRVGATHQCLTNCELRAGRGMQGFVAPSSDYEIVGPVLRWDTGEATHEIRWAP